MSNHDAYLRSNMQGKYSQLDAAKQDAINTIRHYKDLKPKLDRFIYNDGSSKQLINLCGTIPVMYKRTTYNIPVAIWLQEAHPQLPPMCFVKPTSSMQVRQGKHVDANGKVYLPYLSDWRQGTHNTVGCVQVMIAIFSEEPPVFAKPAQPQRPTPPQRPAPPPPHTGGYPHPTPVQPYPPQSRQAMPYPQTPGYPHPGQQQTPYPQQFTAQGPPTSSYQPQYMPTPNSTPYPNSNQAMPYPSYSTPGFPTTMANSQSSSPYPAQPPKPKESSIDDQMIKASLLSAVNDKLKRRLKDTLGQAEAEMGLLKQAERELKTGTEKLDNITSRIEQEIQEADTNLIILQQKNDELERELGGLQQKQDNIDLDETVMATTPVYNQIVSSFSEEQGLEDTIYYLGEALHKDVVDLDLFLKHVRSLSRQQFMLRAIIQKARKVSGLADVY